MRPLLWRWRLPAAIAWRYLRGSRSRLLTGTALAALGSTGLGTAAMVVSMSLMNGYTEDLQGKMLESGAIIITPVGMGAEQDPAPYALQRLEDVSAVTFAVFAQAAVISQRYPQGLDVYLRGVEPGQGRFGASSEQLRTDEAGIAGAVLGADLASRLQVGVGDRLRIVALGIDGARFRFKTVRMSGTFHTGFSQFDQGYIVVDRSFVESLGGSGIYEVAVRSPGRVDRVLDEAEKLLGDRFLVRDWRLSNPGLFTALRLQKWGLFLMLGLIVVVSTFNVASTLVVLVRDKMRDVGLLASLGLRGRGLRRVFVLCGLLLGLAGTALGIGAGVLLSWLFTTFGLLRFDPAVAEIYFLSAVPFRVRWSDLLAVAAFSQLVTLFACWLPATRATRLEPAVALRYE